MANMNIHELIKLLGMIWEDLNLRIMKYLLMKVIEYPYVILMIKDIFFSTEYILYHMVTKIYQQETDKIIYLFFVNS